VVLRYQVAFSKAFNTLGLLIIFIIFTRDSRKGKQEINQEAGPTTAVNCLLYDTWTSLNLD